MSNKETTQKTKGQSKVVIVLLALIVVIVVAFAVILLYLLSSKDTKDLPESNVQQIGNGLEVEANLILDDPKTLQDAVDEMLEKVAEGQMSLEMEVEARSADGENFSCYLANADQNSYDMYMMLYRDDTQELIYQSGIIPIGARIESFTTNVKMDPGMYVCTLVFCQLEEDGETIHAQVNVGLNLSVTGK